MEFISDVSTEDQYRPSFFELIAQDQLRDLLAPVVRYVLSVLAQRNPRYLLRIVNRHDEFYATVMFFVERHYLKVWGASFAENFYGLKRRQRPRVTNARSMEESNLAASKESLSSRDIRSSLFFLVGIPYLKSKAAQLYEDLGGGVSSDLFADNPTARANRRNVLAQETRRQKFKRLAEELFKLLYPRLNVAYEVWLLWYNVRYLFDKTPFWRPWLSWMGVDVRRMSAQDYQAAQKRAASSVASPFHRHAVTGRPPNYRTIILRSLLLVPKYTFEALKVLLPASIFFFKFLEWWYSSDYARTRRDMSGTKDPCIKPPKRSKPHPNGILGTSSPQNKEGQVVILRMGHCPLCQSKLVNPTALSTGWVFCYKCVHMYVSDQERCPVTLMPTRLDDLRKVVG